MEPKDNMKICPRGVDLCNTDQPFKKRTKLTGIERYGIDETVALDFVLFHGPFVPNLIDSSDVGLAEMSVKSNKHIRKLTEDKKSYDDPGTTLERTET